MINCERCYLSYGTNENKKELQGSALCVTSEVKKLKKGKDVVQKYQGNKIEFDFNNEVGKHAL